MVITRGSQGAVGFSQWGVHRSVHAGRHEVADTIGAGDSFTAGLLAALLAADVAARPRTTSPSRRDQIARAIDFATRCAAITVSRAGAQPPWTHELQ